MPERADDPDSTAAVGAPRKRGRAAAVWSLVIGIVLLAAAVRVIARSDALAIAQDSLRQSPTWMLGALVALPLANLLLTSGVFWVLTNRHGRVPFRDMTALIAGSWLLSFVGMFGRIAYHRQVHGVPIRASVGVLARALACSLVCVAILLLLTLLADALALGDVGTVALLSAPAALFGLAAFARRGENHRWRLAAALALRYLDMGVWALRYLLIFELLFLGISTVAAAGFAAAAQAAMLLPIQIGAREWIIGLLGSAVSVSSGPAAAGTGGFGGSLSPGLLADLVNRAAELAVALPLGTGATVWLMHRWRARRVEAVGRSAR